MERDLDAEKAEVDRLNDLLDEKESKQGASALTRQLAFLKKQVEANKRALAAKLDVVPICVDPIWL